MKETLITYISCKDENFLWCYDEIICTLSRVDLKTLEAECILSPMQILVNENYEVRKIISWKSKIIILPKEIGHKWVIYDKFNRKIEYDTFSTEKYDVTDVLLMDEKLVFVPLSIKDPITIMDIKERKAVKKIEFPHVDDLTEGYIWNATIDQGDICFLIHDSFFYGRLSNDKLRLIKIEVPQQLTCADFYMDTGWAIDCQGRDIYSFNKEGQLLESYPVEIGTYIARIIVKDRFIFLLPFKNSAIMIFDTNGTFIKLVNKGKIDPKFVRILNLTNYWGYVETDIYICFLPLKYSLQIININTLTEEQKLIEYSEMFSVEKYNEYYQQARTIRNRSCLLGEDLTNATLKKYLELITISKSNIERIDMLHYANRIWRVLNNT